MRKGLEQQIKEMQVRLDEAEAAALKGGKKIIAKLEQRVCSYLTYQSNQQQIDGYRFENSNKSSTVNNVVIRIRTRICANSSVASKSSTSRLTKTRRITIDWPIWSISCRENSKSISVKSKRRFVLCLYFNRYTWLLLLFQEELAATNLGKYRQLQAQLDDAEERADVAENSLSKLRAKNRSTASAAPSAGLASSQSAVFRSGSYARDWTP